VNKRQRENQVAMTEGVIWKQLLYFSIPLLLGNLFQQLYNTVDSVVVGNFVGSQALAAVGSSNSLINLIIGMSMGIGTGAGVIISQYYGAGEKEKLQWAVHTSVALSLIGGVLLTLIGVRFSPLLLKWMGTPEDVMPNSVSFLRIFFSGSIFNLVYNMGAGILRAVGDSKRPLYYLGVSSVVNIVLDLLFVAVFKMGTAGAGIATVIAQAVSSVLVVRALMKTRESHRLILSRIAIDKRMMVRILKLGIPTGIQQSIISLSNVVVQANVNVYGAAAMAGFGAYTKIDGFAMLPLQSFCLASTVFTGHFHKPWLYGSDFNILVFLCRASFEDIFSGPGCDRIRNFLHGHIAAFLLDHGHSSDFNGQHPRKRADHGFHDDRSGEYVPSAHGLY